MFIKKIKNYLCLFFLILCGCITEYNAPYLNEGRDILVVEGIITNNETVITLSRSVNLTDDSTTPNYIDNARVYIESDDGTQWEAEPLNWDRFSSFWPTRNGRYTIKTGELNLDRKYCLKIEIEEPDNSNGDCFAPPQSGIICPTKTYEYCSDYSYPFNTPEIDSIFWTKKGRGQLVMIHAATHSPDNDELFCRWSFKEDWEIHSDAYLEKYPFYCWNMANSRELIIASSVRTVFGKITDKVTELSPSNRKLEVLYRITVKQNAISKRAYDYYANIKKNIEQTGSIFAPTPSELSGNIICTTDPTKIVIGYVDVSITTQNHRYIPLRDGVYEYALRDCDPIPQDTLLVRYENLEDIPDYYVIYEEFPFAMPPMSPTYLHVRCVDCTNYGIEQKPDDWPDRY